MKDKKSIATEPSASRARKSRYDPFTMCLITGTVIYILTNCLPSKQNNPSQQSSIAAIMDETWEQRWYFLIAGIMLLSLRDYFRLITASNLEAKQNSVPPKTYDGDRKLRHDTSANRKKPNNGSSPSAGKHSKITIPANDSKAKADRLARAETIEQDYINKELTALKKTCEKTLFTLYGKKFLNGLADEKSALPIVPSSSTEIDVINRLNKTLPIVTKKSPWEKHQAQELLKTLRTKASSLEAIYKTKLNPDHKMRPQEIDQIRKQILATGLHSLIPEATALIEKYQRTTNSQSFYSGLTARRQEPPKRDSEQESSSGNTYH